MSVFVTSLGVNSALGLDVQSCFEALKSGETGIKSNYFLSEKAKGMHAGAIAYSNEELKQMLDLSPDKIIPRTSLLGLLAAKEAYAGIENSPGIRTGFINGTTTGGMDLTEKHFENLFIREDDSEVALTSTHDLGSSTALISDALGITGYVNTISTACSSSANTIMLGTRMINAGLLDRVLVGGCDALTTFTINGFKSLMIYHEELCTPFDENRNGLNLGEGAGYILLENEKSLAQSGKKKLASVAGWANANDAHHQTGSSPEGKGAGLAMKHAMEMTSLSADDIGYLNAHGTATKNNDDSEMAAISSMFGSVDFSSTKGYTGHTLGASGGIEAVFSILSLMNQCAYPNINWNTVMEGHSMKPNLKFKNKEINHVMSNSFGFGGNSSSLIFSKV